jgi:hypothetical protein
LLAILKLVFDPVLRFSFQGGQLDMPADRLVMRQIKDILRLRYDAGLSQREIARCLNLSIGVVSKYLQLAAAAGIGWPPPADLDEDALANKLQPPPAANSSTTPLPDFVEIHPTRNRPATSPARSD